MTLPGDPGQGNIPAYKSAASSTSQLRKATMWGRLLMEGETVIQ